MKKIYFIIVFSSLFQISICQGYHEFLDSTIKVTKENVPILYSQYYFPLSLFPNLDYSIVQDSTGDRVIKTEIIENVQDTSIVKWYSIHLRFLKEPLLFNKIYNKEIYRFTWLRTFHNPIVIRIEKDENEYTLFWKLGDGAGGNEPIGLILSESKKLNKEQWDKFKDLIIKMDFWNLDLGRLEIGIDGSEWILEGVSPSRYKVTTAWSPNGGDFFDACDYLLSLTSLKIKDTEKY